MSYLKCPHCGSEVDPCSYMWHAKLHTPSYSALYLYRCPRCNRLFAVESTYYLKDEHEIALAVKSFLVAVKSASEDEHSDEHFTAGHADPLDKLPEEVRKLLLR